MSRLKEADFYYGAVLSSLFNHVISPMLIEGGEDRQVYEFTTDHVDFRLFIKYRSENVRTQNPDYCSWQFHLSYNDIGELKQFMCDDKHLSLGLVCGMPKFSSSEFAVLHKEELRTLLDSGKDSLTISRKKGERAFRISMGGGRDNAMQIKSDRLF